MNIVGKILVILNLVFALVVAGFVIVDSATRTNYKAAYDALQKEVEITKLNKQTWDESSQKEVADARKFLAEKEAAEKKIHEVEQRLDDEVRKYKAHIAQLELRATDADVKTADAQEAANRLKEEVKTQLDILKQRDQVIVKQQEEFVTLRNRAVNEENARKAAQARLEQALGRIAELTAALTKATTGAAPNTVTKGTANPPPVFVTGKIEDSDQGSGLVKVSVGSDKGLAKDHTLEVYRTTPEPTYLGMIRLVDVEPHWAIGRIVRQGSTNRGPLRVGDTVSSTLSRN